MTNRENVFRALKRNKPESVPFDMVLCPSKEEEFRHRTGSQNYMEYYKFPFRYVEPDETILRTDFTKYYKYIPPNSKPINWNPEWGVLGVGNSSAHFQEILHPMENFSSIEEIVNYPFPDFDADYRWENVDKKVKELVDNDLISVAFLEMTIFEMAWYLWGMEKLFIDMIENPDIINVLFDLITQIRIKQTERFAKSGVDILMLGDDVATQRDMLMSFDMWKEFLKPRLASVIKAAKDIKKDMLILYHSDGNCQKIIPDLIEIGVEILNPVQSECMDPCEIKKLYGDRLSFWGTLGTQTVLPFGTPMEVKNTCKKMIEIVGKGGGLLLSPTHVIEPEVPWDNIQTFIDAVYEFGKY